MSNTCGFSEAKDNYKKIYKSCVLQFSNIDSHLLTLSPTTPTPTTKNQTKARREKNIFYLNMFCLNCTKNYSMCMLKCGAINYPILVGI